MIGYPWNNNLTINKIKIFIVIFINKKLIKKTNNYGRIKTYWK